MPSFSFIFFASTVYSAALDVLATQGRFTLEQQAVERTARYPIQVVQEAYWKHGFVLPSELEEAVQHVEQIKTYNRFVPPGVTGTTGTTTVAAESVRNDLQYLIEVKVGKHDLMLDLDTGSSDLWVMSTLLNSTQKSSKSVERLYDPGLAQELQGAKWQIRYGDKSSAGGKVFLDQVKIGNLVVPNQAVEAATQVSTEFAKDGTMDGLIGLGSGKLNTIKPKAQPTWFENVKTKLKAPLFSCALKRHAAGTFDFGFIDQSKYTGKIAYTPVHGQKGFWDFQIEGYAVGNDQITNSNGSAIADTGSSLWYAAPELVNSYWAKVQGAAYDQIQGGFAFPCSSKLPDMNVVISGTKLAVHGENMNYQSIGRGRCFGGLQRNTGMPFSIYGDVFLKGLYVIFEHAPGQNARIGFAQGTFR